MPVIKKVQSKIPLPPKEVEETKRTFPKDEVTTDDKGETVSKETLRTKKVCQFCKASTEPKYWDTVSLRRFLNDRGRIASRGRGGCCAKHQRRVSREIKRARHLALLPFTIGIR